MLLATATAGVITLQRAHASSARLTSAKLDTLPVQGQEEVRGSTKPYWRLHGKPSPHGSAKRTLILDTWLVQGQEEAEAPQEASPEAAQEAKPAGPSYHEVISKEEEATLRPLVAVTNATQAIGEKASLADSVHLCID